MTERNLDALLLTSEANRCYAAGFRTMAPDDAVVLITRKNAYFITDSRYIEAAQAEIHCAEVCLREGEKGYMAWLKELCEKDGVETVGFEQDQLSYEAYERYASDLPVKLVPSAEIPAVLRRSKDEGEIQNMICAQRIAEDALEELILWLKVGQSEKEIAAYLQYLMLSRGAERMSFDPIAASGENSSMPHAVPTDRRIREGDFLTLDFGCVYGGYCSDMTRTLAIGNATAEMEKVYYTVLRAQEAGIAKAAAGVPGCEVHNAAQEVIDSAGYAGCFGHSFGHSLGLEIHESPNFSPKNKEPMPVGAVVSAEPGIYLPGRFGVRIEDVVILREGGCEDITFSPKQLRVIPALKER